MTQLQVILDQKDYIINGLNEKVEHSERRISQFENTSMPILSAEKTYLNDLQHLSQVSILSPVSFDLG